MKKSTLLAAVAASVQATPAHLLTKGDTIDRNGCRCAIGAYAYDHIPSFKETADSLVADPITIDTDEESEKWAKLAAASAEAYRFIVAESGPGRDYSSSIWVENDGVVTRNRGRSIKEAEKAALIARLEKRAAEYAQVGQ
jgi:hypothetical protein